MLKYGSGKCDKDEDTKYNISLLQNATYRYYNK